jgi:hypothetical protein
VRAEHLPRRITRHHPNHQEGRDFHDPEHDQERTEPPTQKPERR